MILQYERIVMNNSSKLYFLRHTHGLFCEQVKREVTLTNQRRDACPLSLGCHETVLMEYEYQKVWND